MVKEKAINLRFSVRQFLAIVTAWCIAFAIAPHVQWQNVRSHPRFFDATNHVEILRRRAMSAEQDNPGISRQNLLQDPLISNLLVVLCSGERAQPVLQVQSSGRSHGKN